MQDITFIFSLPDASQMQMRADWLGVSEVKMSVYCMYVYQLYQTEQADSYQETEKRNEKMERGKDDS